jgi:hypothetical protein
MANLTVVAIPEPDDYIWKISQQKIPHLTILHIADSENQGRIFEFLQHVANTTMHRFGLSVERRGLLGKDDADVLFFKKSYCNLLEQARNYLLQNNDIRKAFDSIDQFPEWTPHITLGFPETPAHPDTRDYPGIHWINFDRLALWTGDFEGPEILLKDDRRWEVSMSNKIDEFLEHFGIRGMRWGVRNKSKLGSDGSTDFQTARTAAKKAKKGGAKSLSNAELQNLINRMNLEQQYARVVPPSTGARIAKSGGKFVGDVLISVGKAQATKLANDQATKLIATILK